MSSLPKRVLVATDFSVSAARAIRRASLLASVSGMNLELLHVIPGRLRARTTSIRTLDAFSRLNAIRGDIQLRFGIPSEMTVAFGNPPVEIAARAEAIDADLVVIGSHDKGVLSGLLARGTALRLQRNLRTPLLIVRNDPQAGYARALVGIDFSSEATEAARTAAWVMPDLEMHYLHVARPLLESRLTMGGVDRDVALAYGARALLDARRRLQALIRVHALPRRTSPAVVRRGYPPAVIAARARQLGASMVVLGAKGRSVLGHRITGSVLEHFVSGEGPDVLLVGKGSATGRSERVSACAKRALALLPAGEAA